MRNYNYNQLLDFRTFEYFAKSIIEVKENKKFEIFAENKDKGIDLRNIENNICTIVQVKRYKNAKTLINDLEKIELKKVKKLKPDRYIIITSAKLTVDNKEKIQKIFQGINLKPEDIIGCDQLNSMLEAEEYKKVEDEYYQLWINSTRTLDNFIKKSLNADIYNYTKDELDNIKQSAKIYVKHDQFEKALKIIKEKRCLLICGEPEIGKSTLARNLCAYLMNQNKKIEFVYATKLSKIANLLEEDKQQLFFIDDFWGSKFDGNLNAEEENNLKRVIQIITKSKNKILILTSREYILSQGYAEYPELEEFFDKYKLNLHIEDYSDLFKAQILFKHLASSELETSAIYQIANGYQYIINNSNYRPRIIENYIRYVEEKELETTNYLQDFIEYLNHPDKLWKEVFEKQREGAQLITILILLLGEVYIQLDHIKVLYEKYIDYTPKIEAKKKDFLKYISQLENTLITTYEEEWSRKRFVFVQFKNSSIENYIYRHFMENLGEYAKNLIESTPYINVIMYLLNSWNTLERYRENAKEQEGGYYNHVMPKELIDIAKKRLITDIRELVFIDEDLTKGYTESEEYYVHKIIICLEIYQKYPSEDMKEFIKEESKQILKEVKENHYFDYDDLFSIPTLIEKLRKTRIIYDINVIEVIEDVFRAIRFSSQMLILKSFEEKFFQEYQEFYEKNKNKIISRIYGLILDDADFFLADGLFDDLDELLEITMPSLFDSFDLKYTNDFIEEFYELTDIQLAKKETKETSVNIDYVEKEEKNTKYEEMKKRQEEEERSILEEKKALLNGLYNNFMEQDEVEEYCEEKINNKKLAKKLVNLFLDYNKNYIRAFMDGWGSLEILVNFINWLERIPTNSKDFFENFILYGKEVNKNITNDVIQELRKMAYEMFKEGKDYLFKREIAEIFQEDLLEELLNIGFLYKDKKKYYFQTIYFHLYLALTEMLERNEELCEIYEKQESESFKELFDDICYTYSDINLKRFNNDFLKVQINQVIQDIKAKNKETIILKFVEKYEIDVDIDVEVNIEEEMINNGNAIKAHTSVLALEYLGFDIIDMVCKPIDMNEIKPLFIKAYKSTSSTISLKDDLKNRKTYKYKVLEKLGYVQYLEEFYQFLLTCQKKLKENIEVDLRKSFII